MARAGRRFPLKPTIHSLRPLLAPAVAPVPPPIVVTRAAIDASTKRHRINRGHVFRGGLIPSAVPISQAYLVSFKIDHVEDPNWDVRSRRHEQDVALLLNALARKAQIRGTVRDPSLGYLATSPLNWSNNPPLTLTDALDRIAAALKSLGANP